MTAPVPGERHAPTRPDSVALAVQLWAGVIVCEIIAMIAQYSFLRDRTQDLLDDMAQDGQTGLPDASTMAIASMILVIVVLSAITLLFMKATWDGRNWGRQGLGVLSAFLAVQLVFGVIAMFSGGTADGVPAWMMIFQILGGVAAIGALVSLMNADTANYCRDMGLWRKHKKFDGGMR